MQFNFDLQHTQSPPVMEARKWLGELSPEKAKRLINVSQAAPVDPPPVELREAIADALLKTPELHLYGSVRGRDDLREALAQEMSNHYQSAITLPNVTITSGCNQAFCAAIASLCQKGDAVILPTPWYFNHEMYLRMSGIEARPLLCDANMLPDLDHLKTLIDRNVKAITLVSPNNPTGVEYPSELIQEIYALAQSHKIAVILDETYRDFDSREAAPHSLFEDSRWGETLIHLYSFSKAYRLTGHRVGALVTGEARQKEIEKYLDTQTICPNQIGQFAALWGIENLKNWLAGERKEIISRARSLKTEFNALSNWKVKSVGAYFAYVEHGFNIKSDSLARRLVEEAQILLLPGTMFAPFERGDFAELATKHVRIAFANIDATGIKALTERLSHFTE